MIHPHTELRFIDEEIGYGVFATRRIPKGTITWARDAFDLEFSPIEVSQMDEIHASLITKYAYRNRTGNFLLCWDFGRYLNHSFLSNCLSTGYDFELAIRDIEAGEEITDDYGYLNLLTPFQAREENSPRKYVYPDDLVNFHREWDAAILSCLPSFWSVEQPLLPLIPAEDLLELGETMEGRKALRSILTHYFQDPFGITQNLQDQSALGV